MALLQGILLAVVALVLYSVAVREIGTAQTAAFGALTPIMSLTGGFMLLNEAVFFNKIFGIILVSSGVVMASGIFQRESKDT